MTEKTKNIVIAGDITVDWLMYPVEAADEGENWRLHGGMHSRPLPGGALLLARFLRAALQARGKPATGFKIYSPKLPNNLGALSPDDIVHSNAVLTRLSEKKSEEKTSDTAAKATPPEKKAKNYRVKEMLGYFGPKIDALPRLFPLKPRPDPDFADILVLDDPGNGFRCYPRSWPAALEQAQDSLVIYKMNSPLTKGDLWQKIRGKPDLEKLLVIVNADDLRRVPGVNLSKSLSWERTATDFLFNLYRSQDLATLQECFCLVVLCGIEGAILHFGGEEPRAALIFDPSSLEGLQATRLDGRMIGLTSIFTATLTAELAACGLPGLDDGIKRGLWEARTLLESGYTDKSGEIDYPWDRLFQTCGRKLPYASVSLFRPRNLRNPDPDFWRILDQRTRHTRPTVAAGIVQSKSGLGLQGVPIGTFGELQTIDRAEIESYSAIRELMMEFLADPQPKHPLCFAVFGPPGSGKSFGVKQVVKSLEDDRLKTMTFNLSQFRQYQDLVTAFHKVRDLVLAGNTPLVLFDEFDCAWEGQPLGWLKYFLAPMQDGEFIDGQSVFHLGKTILAFIGGTKDSYEEFTRELRQTVLLSGSHKQMKPGHELPEPSPAGCRPANDRPEKFRDLKGPDFVSRLRGFINIMGPNCQGPEDDAFVLRRAKVFRIILSRNPKTADLFDSQGDKLRLDEGILRAFLHISEYRHGTRSMEAIIEMSRLAKKRQFDQGALPPRDQLDQHVNAEEFLWLAARERFQSLLSRKDLGKDWHWKKEEKEIIEPAAGLIHADYVRHRELEGKTGSFLTPYEELPEDKQQSNLDAAADIPHKLTVIGHGLRRIPSGKEARPPDISDEEVEQLARLEHERWCREKRLQGYRFGEEKDPVKKTHNLLVPFDELPAEIKQYVFEAIYAIPVVLQKLGFEVYRLKEAQELEDPYLVERLARLIHKNYVAERANEGQTLETNKLLVEFDNLSEDFKETNRDQARSIPVKLRHLGYDLRRAVPGETPGLLALSVDDFEQMAKMEHARWNWQKLIQGWIYGEQRADDRKIHPCLVPWKQLSEKVQDYDRKAVRLIPQFLQEAGYEAYLPKGVC